MRDPRIRHTPWLGGPFRSGRHSYPHLTSRKPPRIGAATPHAEYDQPAPRNPQPQTRTRPYLASGR
jgi:hypothetical protein